MRHSIHNIKKADTDQQLTCSLPGGASGFNVALDPEKPTDWENVQSLPEQAGVAGVKQKIKKPNTLTKTVDVSIDKLIDLSPELKESLQSVFQDRNPNKIREHLSQQLKRFPRVNN